ncbi:MAG: GNAT family N-acetyltransferase [Proteobacteria bacterium]|nr:GNAT family N-acetyltransferase [Pseudomonadota bacterium]MBI3497039.1 GNAT family N-acetyltransferase [Pseudomonadota bacterium]
MAAVRLATVSDIPVLATLVAELLQHYDMHVPSKRDISRAIAAQLARGDFLLAVEDDDLLGFASYVVLFPGLGMEPQLYMKDLYTAAAARGRGVAKALLRGLARNAKELGCVRIDWTAEQDNTQAQAVYRALGARIVEDKIYYRLDASAIARLSDGEDTEQSR